MAPATDLDSAWQEFTYSFTPIGRSNIISFSEIGGGYYAGLDDVTVSRSRSLRPGLSRCLALRAWACLACAAGVSHPPNPPGRSGARLVRAAHRCVDIAAALKAQRLARVRFRLPGIGRNRVRHILKLRALPRLPRTGKSTADRPHAALSDRGHSRRRHRQGGHSGRHRGLEGGRRARGRGRMELRSVRLGLRLLSRDRAHDAGGRPRADQGP